jgi:hypothetical protein
MRRHHVKLVWFLVLVFLFAATAPVGAGSPGEGALRTVDIGLRTGFQDRFFGHYNRGRTLLAADFDLDGRVDFYSGNPGDESFVLRNVDDGGGQFHFDVVQVLLVDELAWGGVSFDYDNDGDYDIFITPGGNEGIGFNYLFRNMWLETGEEELRFEDVTEEAGVRGPVPPGEDDPIPVAGGNAVVADYNRDGYNDLFVNVNILPDSLQRLRGRNILYHNEGDGTFTDVTDAVGLGVTRDPTRNSTFLDFDNDGDVDLFESNFIGYNYMWRNVLVETGTPRFDDVTHLVTPGRSEDLHFPYHAFGSATADFNNDGWQDLIVFNRASGPEPPTSPYGTGHALFMNDRGVRFWNVADAAGLNDRFEWDEGVMGCQVGDVNGDGVPDVYVGNGGPPKGQNDQLFLSDSPVGRPPHFANASSLIDYPAPGSQGTPYPYRTHGTNFVDVDGDGSLEIAVSNGGPAAMGNEVREPNRLFKVVGRPYNSFEIRPVGNGTTVATDGVGTRFALTVSREGEAPWTIHRTLLAGSCFPAQNGFEVHFGLGAADTIDRLEITWPDGEVDVMTDGLEVNDSIVVERGDARDSPSRRPDLDHPGGPPRPPSSVRFGLPGGAYELNCD